MVVALNTLQILRGAHFFGVAASVPHTAPRRIHSVRMAISFGGSLGPGGIWISPSWRRTSISTLSSGFPGTIAGPWLPPFRRLSRLRKEMSAFLSLSCSQKSRRDSSRRIQITAVHGRDQGFFSSKRRNPTGAWRGCRVAIAFKRLEERSA